MGDVFTRVNTETTSWRSTQYDPRLRPHHRTVPTPEHHNPRDILRQHNISSASNTFAMRLTRSAVRAEHTQHVDEATDASNPHTDVQRVPLCEVSANTALDPEPTDAPTKNMAVQKTKAKGGAKKGAKGSKTKATQEDEAEHADVVLEDERQHSGSPVGDIVPDKLTDEPTTGEYQHRL